MAGRRRNRQRRRRRRAAGNHLVSDMIGGVISADGKSSVQISELDFHTYLQDRAWRISHIEYQIGLISVTSAAVQISVYNSPGSGNVSDHPTASTGPMVVCVPGKRGILNAKPTGWFPAAPKPGQKLCLVQHLKMGEAISQAAIRHVLNIYIQLSPEIWDISTGLKTTYEDDESSHISAAASSASINSAEVIHVPSSSVDACENIPRSPCSECGAVFV